MHQQKPIAKPKKKQLKNTHTQRQMDAGGMSQTGPPKWPNCRHTPPAISITKNKPVGKGLKLIRRLPEKTPKCGATPLCVRPTQRGVGKRGCPDEDVCGFGIRKLMFCVVVC